MAIYKGILLWLWKVDKNERNVYTALAKALIKMGQMFELHVGERSMGTFPGFASQSLLLGDLDLLFQSQVSLAIAMPGPLKLCDILDFFVIQCHMVTAHGISHDLKEFEIQ